MAQQEMDVTGSLRKIALELLQAKEECSTNRDLDARLEGAAFLLNWIADGLDRELDLAAARAERNKALQLEAGRSPWYGMPLCAHGYQHCGYCGDGF